MKFASKLSCLLMVFVVAAGVMAQDPAVKGTTAKTSDSKVSDKQVLKTFKLKHLSTVEAYGVLQALTASSNAGISTNAVAAISVNQNAKSVFMRGTTEQLQEAERVLLAIDVPAEQLKTMELAAGCIIPVKHASPVEVVTTLQQLKIRAQLLPLSKGGLIFIPSSEAADDAVEVIKAIDIPDQKPQVSKVSSDSSKSE